MRSRAKDRIGDAGLAGILAVLPLLPAGPSYFGRNWPWALEGFFLAALAVCLAIVALNRGIVPPSPSVRLVRYGYATWLVIVAAGTVIGLLERTPDFVLLGVELRDLSRLTQRMHQVADPLYPLRVGLTLIEGGVAFWAFSAAMRRTQDPARRVSAAALGCLIGVGLVSVIAIYQYLTGTNLLAYWVKANPGLTRANSTLDDPNSLASFLVLSAGFAAGIAWGAPQKWGGWRLAGLTAVIVACAALVTTVSRAGWMALVIAVVVCAVTLPENILRWERYGPKARLVARATIGTVAALLLIWVVALSLTPKAGSNALPETPLQAIVQTVDPHQPVAGVLKGRLKIWKAAVDFARMQPAMGLGIGQFPRVYSAYPGADGPENTHNFFLQVLAEAGVLGIAGLTVLLLSIALAIRSGLGERSIPQARRAVGLSAGVLAFVLTWLTGHPMLNLSNELWLACVLAIGLAGMDVPALGVHEPPQVTSR